MQTLGVFEEFPYGMGIYSALRRGIRVSCTGGCAVKRLYDGTTEAS